MAAAGAGLKPKLAYEHGAVGCLIYSDPRDDGYGVGDTYPKGGYRPPDAVQRGSVQDLTLYSGDPLTPGVGAVPGAKRLALKDAKTMLKIPVLPISYAAAQPLLAALGRTGRAGGLARRPAAYLSSRTGTGESAHESAVGLGPETDIRCDREDSRQPRTRSMDHSRQSSRWLGIRSHGSACRDRSR